MSAVTFDKGWADGGPISAILDHFNATTTLTDDGLSFSSMNFQENISLLDDAFRYSDMISSREMSVIVYNSLISLRKQGLVDKDLLLRRVNELASSLLSKPLVRYTMWTATRLTWINESNSFRLKYRNVSLQGQRRLPNYLRLDDYFLDGVGRIYPNGMLNYGYLICRVDARSEDDAARQIFDAVDVFYSLTNVLWRQWNLFGGEHHSEAKVWNGPYQFFFEGKRFLGKERLWFNAEYQKEEWDRSPPRIDEFTLKILPSVRKALIALEDHSLKRVLVRSLKLISDGMIARDSSYRLLRFWSALESLFSENEQMARGELIIKRATFAETSPLIPMTKLRYLAKIRNRYVHAGMSNDSVYYLIQFLRDLVSRQSVYLLFHGADFESHLDYLAMCDLPHSAAALEKRKVAIARRENVLAVGRHRGSV